MRFFDRTAPAPDDVVDRAGLTRGEKVLAAARSVDGTWLLGTRDALVLVRDASGADVTRVAWEHVQAADWSRDDERLRVSEVGDYGRPRPVHELVIEDPGPFLPMVRERVTASVVLQRRVEVRDGLGLMVVARRAPGGGGEIAWAYDLDAGLDPDDPEVRAAAEAGLRRAAEELGLA